MKMGNSFLFRLFTGLFITVIFFSCTKENYYYKDYVISRTYVGKIDSVWVNPGEDRAKISWINAEDNTAKELKIYWDNYKDSITTTIDPSLDTQSIIVNNLPEGDYIFDLVSYDADENHSLPVKTSTTTYGEIYKSTLPNRSINHAIITNDSSIIFWNSTSSLTMLSSRLEYTDKNNNKKILSIPLSEEMTILYNINSSKSITIQSLHHPNKEALDTLLSKPNEVNLSEKELHSLHLTGVGTDASTDFIDLNYVKVHRIDNIPSPSGSTIDLYHLRGAGSKHNFAAVQSGRVSAWETATYNAVEAWDIKHVGYLVHLTAGSTADNLYNGLDENDRSNMVNTLDNAFMNNSGGSEFITLVNTGDVILFKDDRGIYAAIKATYSEPDGIIDIEFKISRP